MASAVRIAAAGIGVFGLGVLGLSVPAGCASSEPMAQRPSRQTEPEIKPFSDLGVDVDVVRSEERDEPLGCHRGLGLEPRRNVR